LHSRPVDESRSIRPLGRAFEARLREVELVVRELADLSPDDRAQIAAGLGVDPDD
jgi:hypothetical protein